MTRANDKTKLSIEEAIGLVHVLTVGASEYSPISNFFKLRQCEHDAAAIAARFSNRPELLGAPDRVRLLSSSVPGIATDLIDIIDGQCPYKRTGNSGKPALARASLAPSCEPLGS